MIDKLPRPFGWNSTPMVESKAKESAVPGTGIEATTLPSRLFTTTIRPLLHDANSRSCCASIARPTGDRHGDNDHRLTIRNALESMTIIESLVTMLTYTCPRASAAAPSGLPGSET